MKLKTLIPFAVILAVLGGIALVRGRVEQANAPTITTGARLVALVPEDLDAAAIGRVELFASAKPEEKVVLERSGEDWIVASQFGAPADTTAVNDYVKEIAGLRGEFREKAATDEAKDAYKLKDGQAFRVQAFKTGESTPTVDVLVGSAPRGTQVFMRKAGDDSIYIEAVNLRQNAGIFGEDTEQTPKAEKWVKKDILAVVQDDVTKLELEMPDKSLVFEKREKPKPEEETGESEEGEKEPQPPAAPEFEWVLASGGFDEKHKDRGITNILTKLNSLRVADAADPAKKAELGLDPPAFKLTATLKEGDPVVIEGGRTDPKEAGYIRLAKSDKDIVYKLDKWNFEQLFPKGGDLFDLPKQSIDRASISRVEIERPEGRVVVAKVDDAWKVEEPVADLKVQTTTLDALATALSNWTPTDYAETAVDDAAMNITIRVTAGDTVRTLRAGGEAKVIDGVYARVEGVERPLVMSRTDATRMLLKPRDVYQLNILDFEEDQVEGLQIKHEGHDLSLTKDGETWRLNGTTEASAEKCGDFLASLDTLQAKDFRLAGGTIDGAPVLTIGLKAAGQSKFLTVGPEKDGIHLMSITGTPTIFEIDQNDADNLIRQIPALAASAVPEPAPAEESAAPSEDAAPADAGASGADAPAVEISTDSIAAPAEDAPSIEISTEPAATATEAPSIEISTDTATPAE